jgi:hypothetical protein
MAIADQQESSLASCKRSNCILVQGSGARGLLLAHGRQSCRTRRAGEHSQERLGLNCKRIRVPVLVGCKKWHQMTGGYHDSSLGYITMEVLKKSKITGFCQTPHRQKNIYEAFLIHNRSSQKTKNRI